VLTERDESLTAVSYEITRRPELLILEDGSRLEGDPEFLNGYIVPDDPTCLEHRTSDRLVLIEESAKKSFFRITGSDAERFRIDMRRGD
jgi:hypothetical protein